MLSEQYRTAVEQLRSRLAGRTVVMLFSGGFDSVVLLSILLSQGIQKECDLRVVTIAVPDDIYHRENALACGEFLQGLGCRFDYLVPEQTIPATIAYASACPLCKKLRQDAVAGYTAPMLAAGKSVVFLTGHNLDDLASYTLEMLARSFDRQTAEPSHRYYENANKFISWFAYNQAVTIYRPLTAFTKGALTQILNSYCDASIIRRLAVIKQPCRWLHQRKRILQEYLESSQLAPEYEQVCKAMETVAPLPDPAVYARYPYTFFLM